MRRLTSRAKSIISPLDEAGGRVVVDKDVDRMHGIMMRANGVPSKAAKLAFNMAKAIKDKDKAIRRGKAALEYRGMNGPVGKAVAKAFYQRAVELGSSQAKKLLAGLGESVMVRKTLDRLREGYADADAAWAALEKGKAELPADVQKLFTKKVKSWTLDDVKAVFALDTGNLSADAHSAVAEAELELSAMVGAIHAIGKKNQIAKLVNFGLKRGKINSGWRDLDRDWEAGEDIEEVLIDAIYDDDDVSFLRDLENVVRDFVKHA